MRRRQNRRSKNSRRRKGYGSKSFGPRSFITQNEILSQPLNGWFENQTDGSGVCSFVVPSDPTLINNGTQHPHWAAYSAIYSEVKVVSLTVWVFPRFAESKSVITDGTPLIIAGSTNVTSPPSSLDVVADNASARGVNILNMSSPNGYKYWLKWRDILWGPVGSPGGITSTGCPGGIGFYGTGYAASVPLAFVQYSLILKFRNLI